MKTSAKIIIVSSLLGFLNAIYLTYLYIEKMISGGAAKSFCDINNSISCSDVIFSPYVRLFGIPFFMVAMLVYPLLALLGYLSMKKKEPGKYFLAIAILSAVGMTMNIVFMNNEIYFAGAVCLLCVICLGFIIVNLLMGIKGLLQAGIEKRGNRA